MKIKEIREYSDSELANQLEVAYQERFNLRFRAATKQLVNHREIPRVRRDIARLKTIIRERKQVIS